MNSRNISMVMRATDTETRDISVAKVMDAIRTGGKNLKGQITQIRNRFEAELVITGDRKKAKLAVDALKRQLPGVTPSGRFKKRASDALIEYSGLLCIDIDSLGERLPKVRNELEATPYVVAVFLSPTGDGLKVWFRASPEPSKHLASFRAIRKHVRELTRVEIDESCKDLARLCFMSYDPTLYVNENAVEITSVPEPEKPTASPNGAVNLTERQRIATELLGQIEWESETSGFVVCPGKHLHTTGDGERDCKIDFDNVPTVHCFHDHCRGILDGVNHELRSQIGKTEYAGKREPPQGADRVAEDGKEETDLTSFSSCAADYPTPPDDAAFYGLAGDVVRRIEPQTEADPVALLVQLLAAFGNIIGRNAYMQADGARHYLNLFIVLVGKTSKGRKGTAWRHVLNFMRHVAEGWCQNIAHGLSSGEGLIWAVRDKIEGKKLIKERGEPPEYKTVVIDDGVLDKRLLVIESEFANVLKVGTREGNTLSPVIRSAWEDGNLRTMTKNSPARATDAHISIIGHITREEYRRELTQTESANGFANRYCIVAVERSKCLPEGGQAIPIADLILPLREAIEFATNCGELRLDDAARKLWAKVYPDLSAGKPGLLGAITARAEAQALRLSAIYALLDCSNIITVNHLKAALALWDYCERSAAWVFERGTGNKNADRILAALRVAGRKGLTKEQITADVFKRNVLGFDIDEALRLLHSLKLAHCVTEKTGGRNRERWFYKAGAHEVNEESPANGHRTKDTSFSSYGQPSQNAGLAESDTETEPLVGDEFGVGRL